MFDLYQIVFAGFAGLCRVLHLNLLNALMSEYELWVILVHDNINKIVQIGEIW